MISGASIDRCVRILLTTFYHMHHYTMQLLGIWSSVHIKPISNSSHCLLRQTKPIKGNSTEQVPTATCYCSLRTSDASYMYVNKSAHRHMQHYYAHKYNVYTPTHPTDSQKAYLSTWRIMAFMCAVFFPREMCTLH